MTVKELIEMLKQYPPEMPVVMDDGLPIELIVISEDTKPTLNII